MDCSFGCVVSNFVEGAALGLHVFCGARSLIFDLVGGVSIRRCGGASCSPASSVVPTVETHIIPMDEIHFAPKKPWNDGPCKNQQTMVLAMVSKWRKRISAIRSIKIALRGCAFRSWH